MKQIKFNPTSLALLDDKYYIKLDLNRYSTALENMNIPLKGECHPNFILNKIYSEVTLCNYIYDDSESIIYFLFSLEDLCEYCIDQECNISWDVT
jgi:hypothetical protein